MREMEDARSLAGLAMEVYSDRISVDQEEQERLRFSPDDIVKLPIHRAINVWVAHGVPRGGFIGATLPMEGLRQDDLAQRHVRAQRERGGHHPDHLPDPVAQLLARNRVDDAPTRRSSRGRSRGSRDRDKAAGPRAKQLTFIDVTEAEDPDGL